METKSKLLICFCILAPTVWGQDPLVMTSEGLVRGLRADDGNYSMFLGVPYAVINPDNPFGVALSPPPIEGVFEANDDTAMCPQLDHSKLNVLGTMDCLKMNIYVPKSANSKNLLPVMVWIYGGRFETGSAGRNVYGPQYIVRHDVILVTLNYRLGPYGFMCADVPSAPGNAGLKDQRAALRWINKNIEAFGGDNKSITLSGQSAGGISTEFHIMSNGSRGLFHRAIIESGSVLTEHTMKNGTELLIQLAHYFALKTDDLDNTVKYISSLVDFNLLLKAMGKLNLRFEPCVEKSFEGEENFLPASPLKLLESGQYDRVPILMGYNSDEAGLNLIRTHNDRKDVFQDDLKEYFDFPNGEELDKAAKIIKEFYIGTKEMSEDVRGCTDFASDTKIHPVERSLLYHLRKSDNPIYQYQFAYNGGRNFMKHQYNFTEGGAVHTDEIGYLFKQSYMLQDMSPEDQLITDRITTLWTNFVKFGDPTPSVTELLPFVWPPVTRSQRDCLIIDSDFRVEQRPFHARMAFWDMFYLAYGKYEIGNNI